MLLWASLLVPVTTPTSVISLHPPWTTVFQGDRVNLICNGFQFYAPENTTWFYKDGRENTQTEHPGNTLVVCKSGEYKCQVQGSLPSDPVSLRFVTGPIILQAPHLVFEGDTLILRCQKRGKDKLIAAKYKQNGETVFDSKDSNLGLDLFIPQASLNNSGTYECWGYEDKNTVFKSDAKIIKIQELFPDPKLKATDPQPTEGNPVHLSCETRLPPARLDTPLHFIFFRDDKAILSDWSNSSEIQIPTIWRENSGKYTCGAETVTHSVYKRSLPLEIHVQRIPVSQVSIEIQPPDGQAVEGEKLVLVCSVAEGTGETTFSWHKENTKQHVGQKTQRSQTAELEIPNIRESHSGRYYCTADNSYGPVQSGMVNITVRGIPGQKSGLIALGTCGGFLMLLIAVLFYHRCWRKPGDGFLAEETRSPPFPGPTRSCPVQVELQLLPGNVHPKEEDLLYSEIQIIHLGDKEKANTSSTPPEDNVSFIPPLFALPLLPTSSYSLSLSTFTFIFLPFQCASVIYSEVKTKLPDKSTEKVGSKEENAMKGGKTVLPL
uniref:Fc receptor like 4 n=1 Tax=Oryctolagus cuniculus TaxID=9986 RepID=A0A5F9DQR0_RABIT